MAIYACGVLAGLSAAYLILSATFGGRTPLRDVSVRVWGFRGPIGAFICAWGGVAMLASAPFDDWWHNAYGLDVKIISPPHMVLAAGFFGINFGAIMLMLAFLNRADAAARARLQRMFLYVGGMAVACRKPRRVRRRICRALSRAGDGQAAARHTGRRRRRSARPSMIFSATSCIAPACRKR